ncbi:MAG: hypothetical protein A3K19_23525 [Lentisphaerae bacterium RIFOXYB12_FULL_65_16]|nr:MAG: hypothetical protein A3K18_29280 [Lentisphaerae bacterium RIFOXYA12_64_32]OGV94069.1 MAG: hypothetical protein A3K19_23525 [Lentisphaerae bacterium RIFOXYB12_FULL_65_16]
MLRFDTLITNGMIVDGTGNPWYRGDVGIRGSRIALAGSPGQRVSARETIDAKGKVVCPGFIDFHTHSDFVLLRDPLCASKLKQGITLQVTGQCGISPAPITADKVELLDSYVGFIKAGASPSWKWRSFAEWLDTLAALQLGTHVATMVGHGTVRLTVMGFDNRLATPAEVDHMRELVRESIAAGAFGLTSGLIYPPGMYASQAELVAICAALSETRALYATHMRSESSGLLQSVRDTIEIAERNGIPAQILHHKVAGRKNWGLVRESLAMIDAARGRGIDITADQYPYTAGSTTLRAILPPWVNEGGVAKTIERLADPALRAKIAEEVATSEAYENGFLRAGGAEGVRVVYTPVTPECEGKNLAEIAHMTGKPPLEAAFDAIIRNRGSDNACFTNMCEEDVRLVMQHPAVMIGSDSIPAAAGAKCHPRSNGTFARILGRYVREEKLLRLEEAVRKMTGFTAARLGLHAKGLIRPGLDADLVVFDPATIRDRSDFDEPFRDPDGIEYVFVNGVKAVERGRETGVTAGRVLRRGSR